MPPQTKWRSLGKISSLPFSRDAGHFIVASSNGKLPLRQVTAHCKLITMVNRVFGRRPMEGLWRDLVGLILPNYWVVLPNCRVAIQDELTPSISMGKGPEEGLLKSTLMQRRVRTRRFGGSGLSVAFRRSEEAKKPDSASRRRTTPITKFEPSRGPSDDRKPHRQRDV